MSNSGWMRTEYNYDSPAVCMRIDGKDWMKYFDTDKIFQSDDPEEIAKCARTYIEGIYPFLSGCVVFYVRYDVWQRMLGIGVMSERFKRVPMGQTFPKVRVPSSDNSGLQPGLDECRIEDVLRDGAVIEWEKEQYPLLKLEYPEPVDREKLRQEIEEYSNNHTRLVTRNWLDIVPLPAHHANFELKLPQDVDKSVLRPYLDNAPKSYVKINSPTTDNGMKVASQTSGSLSILPESVQHQNDNETDSGADEPTIVPHTD